MSMATALLSFAALAALLTVTPGIDTAMVLRASLISGRRAGLATAAGVLVGVLAWGVAAAVGVSALVTASRWGYDVLRWVGAAYLVWLGGRLVWSAARPSSPGAGPSMDVGAAGERPAPAAQGSHGAELGSDTVTPSASGPSWPAFRRGLFANLLNPKVGAFYVATIPQFLPPGVSHLAMGLLLAAVHDLEGLVWFVVLVASAHRLRHRLAAPGTRRTIDAVTGGVLVAFGVGLGVSAR